jgi:3-oxoacyl-[acyl-carrier protein] reductase
MNLRRVKVTIPNRLMINNDTKAAIYVSSSQISHGGRRLEGKVAIVTGASRGIGRATAKMFAEEGASVVINYHSAREQAEELQKEIAALGGISLLVKGDVSSAKDVKDMVAATIAKFGKVDILVNNAGIVFRKKFLESTEEDWDRTLDVNLKGMYLCSKEVAPFMLKQKSGKIVNISSIGGLPSPPVALEVVAYVASKAGVIGLTRALAASLAPYVNVNVVCPGYTITDSVSDTDEEWRATRIRETPLKRSAQPEELAKSILFLASSDSDFVTGENLVVSGGRPMT